MAEDKDQAPETEGDDTTTEQESGTADKRKGPRGPTSILTRESDHAARPGFRNAPNQRTKAQKKGRKKR